MPLERFELPPGVRARVLERSALPEPSGESKVFAIRVSDPPNERSPRGGRVLVLLYEARSAHAFEVVSASTARLWRREGHATWKPAGLELSPSAFEVCSAFASDDVVAAIGGGTDAAPRDARGAPLSSGEDYVDLDSCVFRVVHTDRAWLAYEASYPGLIYAMGSSWLGWHERDGRYERAPSCDRAAAELTPILAWADLPALVGAVRDDRRTRRDLALRDAEALVLGDAIFFAAEVDELAPTQADRDALLHLESEIERRHAAIRDPDYESLCAEAHVAVLRDEAGPRSCVVPLHAAEVEPLAKALTVFARGRTAPVAHACRAVADRLGRLRSPGVSLVGSSGWQHRFESEATVTLGRAGDLAVPSLRTDRRHARLTYAGGALTIEDLGSTSGTFVNGVLARQRRELLLGDSVRVGAFTFAIDAWV